VPRPSRSRTRSRRARPSTYPRADFLRDPLFKWGRTGLYLGPMHFRPPVIERYMLWTLVVSSVAFAKAYWGEN